MSNWSEWLSESNTWPMSTVCSCCSAWDPRVVAKALCQNRGNLPGPANAAEKART